MHRVDIGAIGELAVSQDLIRQGWEVYRAIHGNTRVDLVALKGSEVRRIQVKTSTECKTGAIPLYLKKSHHNPKYDFKYETGDFDYFALYCITTGKCIYVTLEEALTCNRTPMFRVVPSKNNQTKNVRYAESYAELK